MVKVTIFNKLFNDFKSADALTYEDAYRLISENLESVCGSIKREFPSDIRFLK